MLHFCLWQERGEREKRKKEKKEKAGREEKKKKKEKIGRKKRAPGGKADVRARIPRATTPAFSSADGDDDGVVERVT